MNPTHGNDCFETKLEVSSKNVNYGRRLTKIFGDVREMTFIFKPWALRKARVLNHWTRMKLNVPQQIYDQ